ncbi:heterokaryon incompatibility protein-domain-containing protein [Xylariaceae sp. AK1471]|nr:heterokaryon incompatibility protein-domain-containing protein [Xylariaceae sp. AK1471]
MPLRGNFRCVNLDIDPFYDAISYTWGDPVFTEEIIIDEVFRLDITLNLRDALVRFRTPLETRSIWADAICINQKNDAEKAKQIPLMTEIYRCASSLLVWLGRFPEAIRSMQSIAFLSQKKTFAASPSEQDEITSALNELVSLPWFSRRWVIQEVVSNPNVAFFCGTISLPWLQIVLLLKRLPSPSIPHLLTLEELWNVKVLQAPPKSETGIFNLLSTFSEAQCSDGRDRIYALASLAQDVVFDEKDAGHDKIVIHIDYTKSEEQVFIDFALAVLKKRRSISYHQAEDLIMEACRRSDGSNLNGLCSWAPDWRLPTLNYPLFKYDSIRHRLSKADANATPRAHALHSGYFLGEIEDVSECFPIAADRSVALAYVKSLFEYLKREIVSINQGRHLRENADDVLWVNLMMALTAGEWREGIDTLESLDFQILQRVMKSRRLFMLSSYAHFGIDTFKWLIIGICSSRTSVGDVVLNYRHPSFPKGIVVRETSPRVSRPKDMPEVQWIKHWSESMRFHLISEAYISNLNLCLWGPDNREGSRKEKDYFHII